MNGEEIDARSDRGLEILKEAFRDGEMVLEFRRTNDGIAVMPIGDHVEELERQNKALRNELEEFKND